MRIMTQFTLVTAWNTQCAYTEHGQRISVWTVWVDGKLVAYYMHDLDRGIDYYWKPLEWVDASVGEIRAYVMRAYLYSLQDRQVYEFDIRPCEGWEEAKARVAKEVHEIDYPVWYAWRNV